MKVKAFSDIVQDKLNEKLTIDKVVHDAKSPSPLEWIQNIVHKIEFSELGDSVSKDKEVKEAVMELIKTIERLKNKL